MSFLRTTTAALAAVLLLSPVIAPTHAQAALLTYDFEGVIDSTDAGLVFGTKTAGDTFTGSFTLDTDATETFSGSNSAGSSVGYAGAFEYSIDGTPLGGVELFAAESVFGYDTLGLVSTSTGISLDFNDSTGAALSGLGVPATPMVLSDWDYIRVYYGFDDLFGSGFFVEDIGTLTSLTLRQSSSGEGVPAPGALVLLGFGLLGLGLKRRVA